MTWALLPRPCTPVSARSPAWAASTRSALPIVPSMTYPYEQFDKIPYPVYGRTKTPTTSVLEERLAVLEGGEACVTAGSGSQALFNLLFTICRPGDNIVTSLMTFGEGYKQAATIFPERCGVQFRFVLGARGPEVLGRGDRRAHEAGLGRDALQPDALRHRPAGGGRRGPQPRRPADGRQHDRDGRTAEADGASARTSSCCRSPSSWPATPRCWAARSSVPSR